MFMIRQCNSQTCIKSSTCANHAKRPEQGGSDLSAGERLPVWCMYYAEAVMQEQREGV